MQKSIVLFFILGITGAIISQELPKFVPPSPEAAALAKFINTPVNHSTGLPSITIPFYTIQTKSGLSIPISISYHASGIRVNEHATQVGLGWKLNTGGTISSEAYGETDGYNTRKYPDFAGSVNETLKQFDLIGIDDGLRFYCASPESMTLSYNFALEATGIGAFTAGKNKIYDTQPDIFYYETPNASGKFILDSDNNVHTVPYAPITIEKGLFYSIKDENGNLFQFNELCSTSVFPNTFILSQDYVEQIKLSKITTHLGEDINYFYSPENYEYKNPETFIDYHRIPSAGCGDKVYYDNPNPKTEVSNKRLDRIEFDEGYIEFTYSTNVNYKIQGSTDRKDLPDASALRRVVVYNNNGQIIKDFELIYSYFESTSGLSSDPDKYRLKLDTVLERGELPYEFVYNGNGSIPHRLSTQQDYWGYYGGNGGLIPEMRFQDLTLSGSDRSVNENLIKTGTLEEISYPTGGKTKFYFNEVNYTHPQPELQAQANTTPTFSTPGDHIFQVPADSNNILQVYFNNDCGNVTNDQPLTEPYCIVTLYDNNNTTLLYNVNSNIYNVDATPGQTYTFRLETNPFQPCNCSVYMQGNEETEVMVDKKTQLPGLRLDRMVKEPVTGEPIVTTFDYSIPGTNRISKDVVIPTFGYVETNVDVPFLSSGRTCHYFVRKGTPVISNRSTYEYITENTIDNGYVRYHYKPSTSSNNSKGALNLGLAASDGGKLLSREVYSKNDTMVYKEDYTYESDYSVNQLSSDYRNNFPEAVTLGMSFNSNGTWEETCMPSQGPPSPMHYMDYNIYHFNRAWVKNTNKTSTNYYYDGNGVLLDSLVVSNDYTYLDHRHAQVNRTRVRESKGDTVTTHIKYAHDVNYAPLIDEHRIAAPLETMTTVTNSAGSEVFSEKTVYKEWGNTMVLPQTLQTLKGEASQTNQPEDRIIYHDYDDHGNPLEVSKADGVHILYVWGYDDTQPIAKVGNATYENLTTAQQTAINEAKAASDNDVSGTTENTLRVKLKILRDAFPQALVTTFTYDPLVGVTSVTDPRGYSTHYEYDAFNRLTFVKDQDGYIVSKHEYHYKSQN
ncbi:RHS repeat protein [Muricauda sp. SCSIO 64092]|uniref:RHS repeat protein n=1 Tax=Allomuricauda sp. SCSIO 64092 TaxID=2908842 RepID=UPI001FF10C04|nr:RHS repeat domain-containing protein [Muricauda sp. SCSIO 64092]UOY08883.1 RHS repeat protein [Muricauda sp. SCSIO 64092]